MGSFCSDPKDQTTADFKGTL
jgi:Ca2+-binding EF-hand superfamily protein